MISKEFGYIRIACSTYENFAGNLSANYCTILNTITEYEKENVGLLVFAPNMLIGDIGNSLIANNLLLERQEDYMAKIISHTSDKKILVAFCHYTICASNLSKVVSFIYDGHIIASIPAYRLDDEIFPSVSNPTGEEVPMHIIAANLSASIGLTADDDIQLLLESSEFLIGSYDFIRNKVVNMSASNRNIVVYVNSNGISIIAENGKIIDECSPISAITRTLADADLQIINNARALVNRRVYQILANPQFSPIIDIASPNTAILNREISKTPFLPTNARERFNNLVELFSIQTNALYRRIGDAHARCAVIGISGGLDSTLALIATCVAFKKAQRPLGNIIAVTMPGFGTTDRTYDNAIAMMESLGVTKLEIPIKNAVLSHFEDIGHDLAVHDSTYENAQARERTQILMDLANKHNGIVIGTGDLSEIALGWCTYNGDHMSMFNANSSIPKTLIKEVLNWFIDEFLHDSSFCSDYKKLRTALRDVIATPISPELLPSNNPNETSQKTEEIVGPYELIDFFIYYHVRYGFRPSKIHYLAGIAFANDYSLDEITKHLRTFYKRFFSQQFKRTCAPDGVKVGTVDLSYKSWQMASNIDANLWLEDIE